MLQPLKLQKNNDTVTVCGIPFSVVKNGKKVESITGEGVAVGNAYPVLFFLGLCNEELFASEWWGPNESIYDHSAYSMSVSGVAPEYIRVGPFKSDDIKTNATLLNIKKINAYYYAYIKIEE